MGVCYSSVHSHKPAAVQAPPTCPRRTGYGWMFPTLILCWPDLLISIGAVSDGGRMQGAGTNQTQGCAQSHQHRNQFEKHNEGKLITLITDEVQQSLWSASSWRHRESRCVTAACARPHSCHIISLYRTSTKCWPHPACLEKGGKRAPPSPYKLLTAVQSSSCSNCPSACVSVSIRSNRSSPATESPDIPSPIPDPAFQLAVEAKELVEGVCTLTSDTGTELTNPQ